MSSSSTVDAPPGWWNDLSDTVVLEDFVPTVYSPSNAVKSNHALFSSVRENNFDISKDQYKKGILVTGTIFICMGVATLLLMPIIYCCVAKVACCCRSLKHSNPKDSRLKWLFLLASLFTMAGAALSIAGFAAADSALDSASSDVNLVGNILTTGANSIRNVVDSASGMLTAFQDFLAAAVTCSQPAVDDLSARYNVTLFLNASVKAAVQDFFDNSQKRLDSIDLDTSVRKLAGTAYSVQQTLDDTKTARRALVIGVFTVNMFVVAVFVLLGWLNFFAPDHKRNSGRLAKCSKWLACLASPVTIMLIFASWVITAGSFMASSISGDFCVDPVQNTFDLAGDDVQAGFYLLCSNDNAQALPVATYYARVGFANALEGLGAAFSVGFEPDSCMANSGALQTLSNAFYSVWTIMATIQEETACSIINNIYSAVTYKTVCTDLTHTMRLLVSGSMCLALSLIILMLTYRILVEQRSNASALEDGEPLKTPDEEKAIKQAYAIDGTTDAGTAANSAASGVDGEMKDPDPARPY